MWKVCVKDEEWMMLCASPYEWMKSNVYIRRVKKEVNEFDYEFLEAERKVDAFFDEKYSEEDFHSTCPLVAQTTIWEASMC